MPKSLVGWGLIGSSGWADSTFGPAISAADGATFQAVLGSSMEKAQAFCKKHEMGKPYADLAKFLADESIHAVWVASPNHLHAAHAIAALEAGKHVLCEKPMAINVAECENMIAAAHKTKRVLGVGYHLRHHPMLQELQEEWAKGAFGEPVFIRAQLYYAYPAPPPEWRQKRKTSGGWALGDVSTHLIDLCRWFLGDVAAAQGVLTSPRFGFETDDHAVVTMRFKKGALAVTDGSTGAGGPSRLELYGTESYCICENAFFGPGGVMLRGRMNEPPHVARTHVVNPYRNQVEAFNLAVWGDRPFSASAADGLENVKVMQTARGY
jgi:1,5-anhydro-D-fructose reductase (1,5-anhydro-D-mannitol-forming)